MICTKPDCSIGGTVLVVIWLGGMVVGSPASTGRIGALHDDDYNLFKEKLMARIPKMSTPLGNIPWIDAVAVMLVLGAAISFGAVAVA